MCKRLNLRALNLSPGALYFSADGTEYRIIFDNLFVLLQTQSGQDPLDFSASIRKPGDPKQSSIDPVDPTPEPTSFVLLGIGLLGLGWRRLNESSHNCVAPERIFTPDATRVAVAGTTTRYSFRYWTKRDSAIVSDFFFEKMARPG